MTGPLIAILSGITISLVAFLIGRQLVLWYFRVNEITDNLISINKKMDNLTDKQSNDKRNIAA